MDENTPKKIYELYKINKPEPMKPKNLIKFDLTDFDFCFENGVEMEGLYNNQSNYVGILRFPNKKLNKKTQKLVDFLTKKIQDCNGKLEEWKSTSIMKNFEFYIPANKIDLWRKQSYKIQEYFLKNNYKIIKCWRNNYYSSLQRTRYVIHDGLVENLIKRITEKQKQ